MLKLKHEVYVLVVLLLSVALLCLAAGCKLTEPAVSEALVAEPAASTAPVQENQALSLSLPLPEDAATGDILIAQVCYSGGGEVVVAPPSSDWVAILQNDQSGELYTVSYYKVLKSESEREAAYVFTLTDASQSGTPLAAAGKIVWVRGIDPNSPVVAQTGKAGDGTDLLADGVKADGSCVFVTLFSASGNAQITLSGDLGQANALYNECSGGFVLCAAEQRGETGASGNFSATASKGGAWTSQRIALRIATAEVIFRAGTHGTLTADKLTSVSVPTQGGIDAASIPKVNADYGYYFVGWSLPSTTTALDDSGVCALDVSGGVTLTAQYQPKTYSVSFVLGEHGTSTDRLVYSGVHLGASIHVPKVTAASGWTFTGWDKTPSATVKGNATYTAQYTQNLFTVTFVLGDHGKTKDTLVFSDLKSGDTIGVPTVHADAGWTFDGWDTTPVTTVSANATYTAQYSIEYYTVTFVLGEHGSSEDTLVFTDLVNGDVIAVPNVTPADGWSFDGWDITPETTVSGDATYTAVYTEAGYTVTFHLMGIGTSEDQLVFTNLHDGDTITEPAVLLPMGYMFLGWSPELDTNVTGNADYYLQYRMPPVK